MTDIFYVGWEQKTSDMLNIGLDRNNSANQYMFYNVGGNWNNSQYTGSWMIRPIVNMNSVSLLNDNISSSFKVFPNPASNELKVNSNSEKNYISFYDITGKLLFSKEFSLSSISINISDLSKGIYILRIENELGLFNKKILIN